VRRWQAALAVNLMNCHPLKRPVQLEQLFPEEREPGTRKLSEMDAGERLEWLEGRRRLSESKPQSP
jgi:hypothetical protein